MNDLGARGEEFTDMWDLPLPADAGMVVSEFAVAGGVLFYGLGYVAGLVAPAHFFGRPDDSPDLLTMGDFLGRTFGPVGYYSLTAPVYAVQKVCWDAPCAFGRFVSLNSRSRKGQVDWLIPRVKNDSYGREASDRLSELTGQLFDTRSQWADWWRAHRSDYDDAMKPVRAASSKH